MTTDTSQLVFDLATLEDELAIKEMMLSMLLDLEEFRHDVKPTDRNVDVYWDVVFKTAILNEKHAIILVRDEGRPIAGIIVIPERSVIEMRETRAVNYGIWVDPHYRRKGVATALQEMAHRLMKNAGITCVVSTVMYTNTGGIQACRAVGGNPIAYMTEVRI